MAKTPESGSAADAIADEAAQNTLSLNPIVGLRGRDFVDAAQTVVKAAILQPEIAVKQWFSFMGDLGKIVAGESARTAQPALQRSRMEIQQFAPRAAPELSGMGRSDPRHCRQGRPQRSGSCARQAPTNGLVSNPTAFVLYEIETDTWTMRDVAVFSELLKLRERPAIVCGDMPIRPA